jgi:hypothetical protein
MGLRTAPQKGHRQGPQEADPNENEQGFSLQTAYN